MINDNKANVFYINLKDVYKKLLRIFYVLNIYNKTSFLVNIQIYIKLIFRIVIMKHYKTRESLL